METKASIPILQDHKNVCSLIFIFFVFPLTHIKIYPTIGQSIQPIKDSGTFSGLSEIFLFFFTISCPFEVIRAEAVLTWLTCNKILMEGYFQGSLLTRREV